MKSRDRDTKPGRDWSQLRGLFEKLPPHAIEAEMSLLGAMLIDPHVVGDVLQIVKTGDDFYKPVHGLIFATMVEIYDTHTELDIVLLNQRLADRDLLNDVGGVDYLVTLASTVPSAANAAHYARQVRDKATIRELIGAASEILTDAFDRPEHATSLLDEAQAKVFSVAQRSDSTELVALKDLLDQAMKDIEARDDGGLTGVPTGFADLDEYTHGFQPGEMIILAARPSMGKTALALNIAEHMAVRNHPVAVFSMEMGKESLTYRLLSARSGVDLQRLRRGLLRPDDFRALTAACDDMVNAPIFIDDTPALSVLQLRMRARRMMQKFGIKAIVVDYLQLMSSGTRVESRQMEVSEISRGIKALARELSVPVICLSQLNRGAEQREGHRPRMSDLRESGAIEQDADVVSMLHREEYYHRGDPEWLEANPEKAGVAELIIAKQRNGPTGVIRLTWDASSTRFRDYADPESYYEPKTDFDTNAASATSGAFAHRDKTGPVSNFRDGGGPTGDDDDVPAF